MIGPGKYCLPHVTSHPYCAAYHCLQRTSSGCPRDSSGRSIEQAIEQRIEAACEVDGSREGRIYQRRGSDSYTSSALVHRGRRRDGDIANAATRLVRLVFLVLARLPFC